MALYSDLSSHMPCNWKCVSTADTDSRIAHITCSLRRDVPGSGVRPRVTAAASVTRVRWLPRRFSLA
ncbi:hypothetical protein GN956_G4056 [Arapaima gigas]